MKDMLLEILRSDWNKETLERYFSSLEIIQRKNELCVIMYQVIEKLGDFTYGI